MEEGSQADDLNLAQDLDFERRSWSVERIAWALIAVVISAALAGLFGPGSLSRATVREPSGMLRIDYARFARFKAPVTIRLHLGPSVSRQGVARIRLSRPYLDAVHIEQVTPHPLQVEAGAAAIIYVFAIAEPSDAASVTFSLKTERFGLQRGCAELVHGPTLCFDQFVYP